MADFSQTRLLGRLKVSSRMLVGGCRVRFLVPRPYCTLDRRRSGLRMIGMLHALSDLHGCGDYEAVGFQCPPSSLWLKNLPRRHGGMVSGCSDMSLHVEAVQYTWHSWVSGRICPSPTLTATQGCSTQSTQGCAVVQLMKGTPRTRQSIEKLTYKYFCHEIVC